jgi:outer membrane protein assembly factor BamB
MLPGQLATTSVARDRVFVGSTNNEIFAFDPDTGRLAWRFPFGGDVIGVAAGDDLVFVVSLDNMVRALNRGNGNQRWRQSLTTRPVGPPQVFAGVVAVPGAASVTTFNSRTGVQIGTFEGPPLVDATPAPFAVSVLAVTRDGRVIGLKPVGVLFKENALEPLTALPGRPLQKEASPLPPAAAPPQDAAHLP